MEKGTPHRKLVVIKAMIEAGKARSTASALAGGAALGFDFDGIVGVRYGADAFRFLQEHDDSR